MKRRGHLFEGIVDFGNLNSALLLARKGKREQLEIQQFFFASEYRLLDIQKELEDETYKPGEFKKFIVSDPKTREIFAAPFRDRVVHHAICRILEPHFEKIFIFNSYACRKGKGQHKARAKAQVFARKYKYYLKCDIKKFFASIDPEVLKNILKRKFKDKKLLCLLDKIIDHHQEDIGLPIGNLTSQHFANLYLDHFDHFIEEKLRVKAYLRYMDDFVIYANSKIELWELKIEIAEFLRSELKLKINEKSTFLRPIYTGIPFLGFVIFRNKIHIQKSGWKRFCCKFKKRQNQYVKGEISFSKLRHCVLSLIGHLLGGDTGKLRNRFFTENALDI